MQWEWIVPVIFLIVWIVSSLIQGAERERARLNRPRSQPGGERPPGTPRRPGSDIDRFLEEVNRRRRQAAEPRSVPTARERPPAATVGPAAPPARPRVSTRTATGRPTVPVRPAGSSARRIPEAIPVTETTAAAEVLAVASVLQATPARRFPLTETSAPRSDNSVAAEPAAATLPPLAELLRDPESLRTAVILHEIFGPPRSRHSGLR